MTLTRVFTTLLALCGFAASAAAQTPPTPDEMRKMLEAMKPIAEHQELAALAGTWTQEITYDMGGGPMKVAGTATNRMILGGRFLVSEGTSPNPAGPGFGDASVGSMVIYGFDRRTQEFTIIGLDTMGTYFVTAAGKKTDPRTVVMAGETEEELAGVKRQQKYDMVLRFIDADTYVSDIIFKFPGMPDQTIVSITHRRLK
ncbi:MAG: DUF1579 family protein [Acidobacteria bacterium]|jgi:hypothetical protein|nr:DUF1579 family protein [Acidobacteriota bacterium]